MWTTVFCPYPFTCFWLFNALRKHYFYHYWLINCCHSIPCCMHCATLTLNVTRRTTKSSTPFFNSIQHLILDFQQFSYEYFVHEFYFILNCSANKKIFKLKNLFFTLQHKFFIKNFSRLVELKIKIELEKLINMMKSSCRAISF